MEARIEFDSFMGSSAVAIACASIVTFPSRRGDTFVPRSAAMESMVRTSPMSGTFEKVTGPGHRSDAAISGSASFLFPVT